MTPTASASGIGSSVFGFRASIARMRLERDTAEILEGALEKRGE
jgi:hypothetical protein